MTAARGLPTTATVVISSPTCELWRIEAASLRGILERDDNISHMLDAAFARNYRDKLSRMNQWAAGAAATP